MKQAIVIFIALVLMLHGSSAQTLSPLSSEILFITQLMQRNLFASFPPGWNFENVATMCDGSWVGIDCADIGSNARIISLYVR